MSRTSPNSITTCGETITIYDNAEAVNRCLNCTLPVDVCYGFGGNCAAISHKRGRSTGNPIELNGRDLYQLTIGERIRYLREQRKMSRSSVSASVGVTRDTMYKWEHDIITPREANIRKLAEVFAVKPSVVRQGV